MSLNRLLAFTFVVLALALLMTGCFETLPTQPVSEGLDLKGLDAPCDDLPLPTLDINKDEANFLDWADAVAIVHAKCASSKAELVDVLRRNRIVKTQ